jgi:hypothetical protein
MAARKQYGDATTYENKLQRVMERFGVSEYNWDYNRHGAWVEFRYKDSLYRFDHTVENAKARGITLTYGSDAFAQIVLALEDLARMVERGIYDLQTWVSGMKYLPPVAEIPGFFRVLGFEQIPASSLDIKERYKGLAKQLHPDMGGNKDDFQALQKASEDSIRYLTDIEKGQK